MKCAIVSSGEELALSSAEMEVVFQQLVGRLLLLWYQGYTEFYLNCDMGVPLRAGEILCQMKSDRHVRLYVAAPHEEQTSAWEERWSSRYMKVHELADAVRFISHPDDADCWEMTDEYLVEHCDLLLVFRVREDPLYAESYAADLGIPVQWV